MPRPARTAVVALSLLALLGGCGSRQASQGSVRDSIEERLLAAAADDDSFDYDISAEDAAAGAACVSSAIFEGDAFTKDERQDAGRAIDGDVPSDAFVEKVRAVFADCDVELPERAD